MLSSESSIEPPTEPPELSPADRVTWQALRAWLLRNAAGRAVLARITADPTAAAAELDRWLRMQAGPAPPQLAIDVSDRAQVDKIIVIAQAGVVTTPEVARDVAGLDNPYLGLAAFTYNESERFAGREGAVAEAVALLTAPGAPRALLFVTGASGSGKSSFAQAGVLPALEAHYTARRWHAAQTVLRPGRRPLAALADALPGLGLPRHVTLDPAGTIGTHERFAAFVGGTPEDQINLVVLDQFEELFTQAEPAERDALLAVLSGLPPFARVRTHVVVTMRSDYLGELFPHRALYDLATKHGLGLREMAEAELRAASERPLQVRAKADARYRGKAWESELVAALAREAAPSAAYLPLLQLTLTELWRRGRLTLGAFEQLGGTLTDAIEARATAVLEYADYDRSRPAAPRPEADQQAILRLLLDLVQVSVEGTSRPDVRRRRALTELAGEGDGPAPEARRRLIDDLVAARLLSVHEEGGTVYVDLIHESLIANWERLRQAVEIERRALRQRARFEQAVQEWLGSGEADAYLLGGVRLAEARELDARHDVAQRAPAARKLFERSVAVAEGAVRRQVAEERRRADEARRVARRARLLAAGLGGFLLAALAATGAAVSQTRFAQQQTELAVSRQLALQATLSRKLAVEAAAYVSDRPDLALLLSVEALEQAPTAEARSSLLGAVQQNHRLAGFLHSDAGRMSSVAFSPDGAVLAAGGADGTVRLWDVAAGRPRGEPLTGHGGGVHSVAFSPDGAVLATAGEDGTVRLWDAAAGRPRGEPLTGHGGQIDSLAFSPDGATFATAGGEGAVRLWDLTTGRPVGEPLTGHHSGLLDVSFSPDGTVLAVVSAIGGDGTVRLWDLTTGRPAGEPLAGPGSDLFGVAFSPDGRLLATGEEGAVRLWDVAAGRPRGEPLTGHAGGVYSVAFSPDGAVLATTGEDGTVRLWDVAAGRPVGEPLTGHRGEVYTVAFSPDGRLLATAGEDGTVRLWDAKAHWSLDTVLASVTDRVHGAAFSPNGATLATVGTTTGGEGAVRLWDAAAGRPVGEPLTGHRGGVHGVAFSPDGAVLATTGEDGTVRLWDAAAGRPVGEPLTGHRGGVHGVAFSPDGRLLATGGGEGAVRLWDLITGQPRGEPLTGHGGQIDSVAFSPDGRLLATGGWDRTVRLWDAAAGRPVGEPLTGHRGGVHGVAFSPDGRLLATAGEEGAVRLWDAAAGRPVGEPLTGHRGGVHSVAFSPDGAVLATAGEDGTVRLWDAAAGRPVGEPLTGHRGGVHSVAFSPDGAVLATTGGDGTVRRWEMSTGAWRTHACRIANRSLSRLEWNQFLGELPYYPACPDPIRTGNSPSTGQAGTATHP